MIYCCCHWTVYHWWGPAPAHHYKCHCIEYYWCCYSGCYSCVSINKHSASKRHSRINSKGTAFREIKITPCCALKVPSTGCCLPAVPSQGPCFPLKTSKASTCVFKSNGALLCPSKMVTLRNWDLLVSTLCLQNLLVFSELWRSQAKYQHPYGLFSLSPSLAATGPLQQLPLAGPNLGVSAMEVYGWCKWTKTYRWLTSLRSRSMMERFRLSQVVYFAWMYLTDLGEKVCGCLGRWGERRMWQLCNAHILLHWVACVRARCQFCKLDQLNTNLILD